MNEDLKRFYEEQDRRCEEFFGMKPGTINLYLAGSGGKSMSTEEWKKDNELSIAVVNELRRQTAIKKANKYKKYADVYHALFPKSNFYRLSSDRQREYIESLKDIV